VKVLAPACRTICENCERACRKHEKKHAVCADCANACKQMQDALAAIA